MRRLVPIGLGVAAVIALMLLLRARAAADEVVPAAADENVTSLALIDQVGGNEGFTYAVDVAGSRVAFGRGSSVVLADVQDPAAPRELVTVPTPGPVRGIAFSGRLIYAAADTAGLQIVDPDAGRVVGALALGDRAYGVDVAGTRVFVAARSQGLRVIDASNPTAPREIGHVITADEAVSVVVRDQFAYVGAWYESMRVIDVSDPTAPEDVSFAPFDSYDNGAVWGVAVDGDLAVAAVPERGIRAIDVSNPRDVRNHRMHRWLLHAPAAVALRGRTAFVADQEAGLRITDLTDPTEIREIGAVDLPGRALSVQVAGDHAFVAAREGGLRIVDISTLHAPREVGYIDAWDAIVDVISTGDLLLAAGRENGVHRYAAAGTLIRELDAPATRLAIDGGRIVTAGEVGVHVYDEGQVRWTLTGASNGAAAAGSILASAGPLGVRFFETSDGVVRESGVYAPEWEQMVGNLHRTPPAAWDASLVGGIAYAAFDDGIHVIDYRDPRRPRALAHVRTPQRVYRLAIADQTLFAACDDGLRIYDLSEPAQPVERARTRTPSFATGLLIDGDRVFVSDLSGSISAVRASDGTLLGSWKAADRAYAITRTREGIAVAAGVQGLRIVSLPAALETVASR